ncbi:UbiH/UbiF/VisC/COQ6 family ubiquinone biosynthesis hydroxylase [Algibacillus agarilyticus]|uniref:UbiH/UbiF/VisC/COQ6 family ubiquinone biosynthesis hydroxylase n=1 Tax=Algibacillus agarilyticus TaxID=2234133 RepID=UPI000DD0B368|nr:UbiH/UbiF/VisC/COQ6 family ubiquinone biosynthesis hydroxylase [Algibacillus agarilyticus]
MMIKADVAIVGSGMIGLTSALALAKSRLNVVLISDTDPVDLIDKTQPAGLRVSAINQASINAFEQLGAWQAISEQRLCAYRGMDVWDQYNTGRVEFNAQDVNAEHLGCIIENDVVCAGLWQALTMQNAAATSHQVDVISGRVAQINSDLDSSIIVLVDGQLIQSKLVIAADGAHSSIRHMMNMPLVENDYQQNAIVATIKTEKPHHHIARQIFTANGPLALLPLYDANLCSIVYSQQTEVAQQRLAMSDIEFSHHITAQSDGVLGMLELCSARQAFPLTMRYSRDFIKHNVVLIGDAAHTIHPLAGQGANLGLMDALAVSECILEHGCDLDELKKVLRWRKSEAFDRIAAMELFHQSFTSQLKPIKWLRSLALISANQIAPIKQQLINEARGTAGRLPKLAQGL